MGKHLKHKRSRVSEAVVTTQDAVIRVDDSCLPDHVIIRVRDAMQAPREYHLSVRDVVRIRDALTDWLAGDV